MRKATRYALLIPSHSRLLMVYTVSNRTDDPDALLHFCEQERDQTHRPQEGHSMSDTIPHQPTPGALRFSDSIGNLATALAAAQGEIQNPAKTKTAKVMLKNGGSYSFAYADLADVFDAIRMPLAAHGLAIVQAPSIVYDPELPPIVSVLTRILHASGEWMENEVKMVAEESRPQVVASAITYAKRYAIQAMLAIVAEEDDDGNAASGNQAQIEQRQRPQRQAAPAPAHQAAPPPSAAPGQSKAKAEHDAAIVSLSRKMGVEEAQHQVAAIKTRCGTNWQKALTEIKALDAATPAGR